MGDYVIITPAVSGSDLKSQVLSINIEKETGAADPALSKGGDPQSGADLLYSPTQIKILARDLIDLPELQRDSTELTKEDEEASEPEDAPSSSEDEQGDSLAANTVPRIQFLAEKELEDFDSVAQIIDTTNLLSGKVPLPFDDPSKVDRILPLQLQDSIPVDIGSFVVDSVRTTTDKSHGKAKEYLALCIQKSRLEPQLNSVRSIGLEPSVSTSRAFGLIGLEVILPRISKDFYALIQAEGTNISIAIVLEGKPFLLKDISSLAFQDEKQLFLEIKSLFAFAETGNKQLEAIYYFGDKRICDSISNKSLPDRASAFIDSEHLLVEGSVTKLSSSRATNLAGSDINELASSDAPLTPDTEHNDSLPADIASALGLAALLHKETRPEEFINFRKGEYAYKPALGDLIKGFRENSHWLVAAAITGLLYLGGLFYESNQRLSRVETSISELVSEALPGEAIPFRREKLFLEENLTDKEEQLRGLGSLASLSPLDSIRELSVTINKQVDTLIDSLNIANSRILIKGSVPDFPAVGRLESALEANSSRFCTVSVQPKGKKSGTSRISFTADIKLCE